MTGSLVNWALFRKELRAALPLALFWWFIWGLPLIENSLAVAPDMVSFRGALDAFDASGTTVLLGGVIGLWLACSLLPAEQASGTVEFLDSLPTSRDRVFWTKAVTGAAILGSGPVLQLVIACGFHALSATSIDSLPPVGVVLPWLLLSWLQLGILFSVALLVSFLRRFAWIAAVLLVVAYLLLERFVPAARVLDVAALTEPAVAGQVLEIPWRLVAVQTPVAVVCLALAWLLYRGAGDWLIRTGERLTETVPGRILLGGVFVLSVGLWIVVPALLIAGSDDDDDDGADEHGVVYVGWSTSEAVTEHYTIRFPTSLAGRAEALLLRADTVHERVRTWFGAEPIGRIPVDATGAGPAIYAGRAFHESIQVDLASAASTTDLYATLGHETAHLYIDAVANDRTSDVHRYIRCVHEGLANHLEHALFRPTEDVADVRTAAALAHAWETIEFEDFIDDDTLSRERDPYLVYTVGEVLIAALVEVHGDDAPVRFLRALGRDEHPEDLAGIDLWRDTCQAAGLDLERVISRFFALLDTEAERSAELIDSLPRPRARVSEERGADGSTWVTLTPVLDGALPEGWRVVARFRRDDGDTIEQFLSGRQENGVFRLPRRDLPGRRAQTQVGLASTERQIVVWDLWRHTALGR